LLKVVQHQLEILVDGGEEYDLKNTLFLRGNCGQLVVVVAYAVHAWIAKFLPLW
jgi:hypothetical protein